MMEAVAAWQLGERHDTHQHQQPLLANTTETPATYQLSKQVPDQQAVQAHSIVSKVQLAAQQLTRPVVTIKLALAALLASALLYFVGLLV